MFEYLINFLKMHSHFWTNAVTTCKEIVCYPYFLFNKITCQSLVILVNKCKCWNYKRCLLFGTLGLLYFLRFTVVRQCCVVVVYPAHYTKYGKRNNNKQA